MYYIMLINEAHYDENGRCWILRVSGKESRDIELGHLGLGFDEGDFVKAFQVAMDCLKTEPELLGEFGFQGWKQCLENMEVEPGNRKKGICGIVGRAREKVLAQL